MFDAQTRHSLAFNVEQTVRVAGAVRDRLSSDNWRLLNRLSQSMSGDAPDGVELDDALDLLDRAIISLVAVGGLEMAHMTRDDGWRFLSIGRHLERLSFVAATLDEVAAEEAAAEPALLEWLLDLSDSLITYRSRHLHAPEWPGVVDLLLFDPRNPRSALFPAGEARQARAAAAGADSGDLAATRAEIDQRARRRGRPTPRRRELFRADGAARRSARRLPALALRPVRRPDAALLQPRLRAAACRRWTI